MDRKFVIFIALLAQAWTENQFCQYTLEHSLCLSHLADTSVTKCGDTKLTVAVQGAGGKMVQGDGLIMNVIDGDKGGLDLTDLTISIQNGGEGTWQVASNRKMTDFERDVTRGLVRIFRPDLLPLQNRGHCTTSQSQDSQFSVTREECVKTSDFESIYHIHKIETEKRELKINDDLQELEATEVLTHYANFNQNIGETLKTNLHLSRNSCDTKVDVDAKELESIGGLEVFVAPGDDATNIKVDSAEQVLKESDPLTLIKKLRLVIKAMDEKQLQNFLKKQYKSSKFNYILEACGSLASYKVHKQIFKTLLPSEKTSPFLEKYLIALSFASDYEPKISSHLENIVKNVKGLQELKETALYCICNQQRKKNKDLKEIDKILSLVGGFECKDSACRRKLMYCLSSIKSDAHVDKLFSILASKGEDRVAREISAFVLEGTQNRAILDQSKIWKLLTEEGNLKSDLYNKILELLDLGLLTKVQLIELLKGSSDTERKCYLSQKMSAHNEQIKRDYSLLSYATQGQSAYFHALLGLDNQDKVHGSFSFSSTMTGSSLSRTAFALRLQDLAGHHKDLITIHSFVGGLSGMTGAADPEDDAEANASLHISILGMPLRPLVLFSSVSDLIDMYWSGAGQEKTTLLQGSVTLEDKETELETILGLRVKTVSSLALHLHSQGEGSVSIWTSSGTGNLNTLVSVAGEASMRVLAPKQNQMPLEISSSIAVKTGVTADTTIAMGSDDLTACVAMSLDDLTLDLEVNATGGGHLSHSLKFPGVTFNLGEKMNDQCSYLSDTL